MDAVLLAEDASRAIFLIDRAVFGPRAVNLDLFAGVQDVVDSSAAISLQLAVEARWFRIAAGLTYYWEEQRAGDQISLSLPTLLGGVRVAPRGGATSAFLEGGLAGALTGNEPMGDATLAGPIGGVHVEHRLGRPTLVGDAHAMFFGDGIRAYRARVGLRVSRFEAALTVLDFNVGPSLYGPELGLAF